MAGPDAVASVEVTGGEEADPAAGANVEVTGGEVADPDASAGVEVTGGEAADTAAGVGVEETAIIMLGAVDKGGPVGEEGGHWREWVGDSGRGRGG